MVNGCAGYSGYSGTRIAVKTANCFWSEFIMPSKTGYYLVTYRCKYDDSVFVRSAKYTVDFGWHGMERLADIIAWAELPEPF